VLPSIIHNDQVGYIKDRYIGENIRTVIDILEYTSLKYNPGILLFIDFEKAFDTISWSFLSKTLKFFNFGAIFQQWIKLMYNNISSCILNNGHSTSFFQIKRGVRQGCPLSALLFILVAEILALNIRNNNEIVGLTFKQREIKITQLADDTTLILKDKESITKTLKLLDHFHKCAGLKLNKSKTEAIPLGAYNNISLANTGIKSVEQTKSLGILISKQVNSIVETNFDEKHRKITTILNMWKGRNITIKGKITILKNKVMPILLYTSSMLYTPKDKIKQFEQTFYDFVWPNRKHHVQKNVLYNLSRMEV
jgi:hypothetical protein